MSLIDSSIYHNLSKSITIYHTFFASNLELFHDIFARSRLMPQVLVLPYQAGQGLGVPPIRPAVLAQAAPIAAGADANLQPLGFLLCKRIQG